MYRVGGNGRGGAGGGAGGAAGGGGGAAAAVAHAITIHEFCYVTVDPSITNHRHDRTSAVLSVIP